MTPPQEDVPHPSERPNVVSEVYPERQLRRRGDRTLTDEELRQSEEPFRSVVANIPEVIYRCECAEPWCQLFISDFIEVLTGYPASDFIESRVRSFGSIIHLEDRERVDYMVQEALHAGVPYSLEYRIIHADGTPRWIADHGRVVLDDSGRPRWIDGVFLDLSRQKEAEQDRDRAEEQLRHQADHDALTGLPNRTLILDRAEQMLLRSRQDHRLVGAFFLDLDNFKNVNDTFGHEAGDDLLKAVAGRFAAVPRAGDTVGRLGGDEFVVLAEGESLKLGPELLADRLGDILREPFRPQGFDGHPISISASIGIAIGARESAHDLLRDADIALYRAKAKGKNCYVQFRPGMQSEAMHRLELD
jgi:diguanylate cyclase (GGDEF)-like protein/PAS domain S-box-containing protein